MWEIDLKVACQSTAGGQSCRAGLVVGWVPLICFVLLRYSGGPYAFPRPGGSSGESQSLAWGVSMGFSCSQGLLVRSHSPSMVLLGRDLKDPLIPSPAMGKDTLLLPGPPHPLREQSLPSIQSKPPDEFLQYQNILPHPSCSEEPLHIQNSSRIGIPWFCLLAHRQQG